MKKNITIKKPRGRPPKNKTWNNINGKWIDVDVLLENKIISIKKKPRGRPPKNKTWNNINGKWIDESALQKNKIITIKKPRGRPPKNKTWNDINGKWVNNLNLPENNNSNYKNITKNYNLNNKLYQNNNNSSSSNLDNNNLSSSNMDNDNSNNSNHGYNSDDQINSDNSNDLKNKIINELKILREVSFFKKEKFRALAYDKAIKSLENLKINSINNIIGLSGFGKSITEKIKKIIDEGKLNNVNKYRNDTKLKLYYEFKKIYGIGDSLAKKLVYQDNILSIEELKTKANKLKLNNNIKIGLKYYNDLLLRIPRKEMKIHKNIIYNCAKKYLKNYNYSIKLVGSYRRKSKDSGDIDIILSGDNNIILKILIDNLIKINYLVETLSYGSQKYLGISLCRNCKIHRRIDILYCSFEKYPFSILYFTGSQNFNIKMRNIALKKGYKLSEHGIEKKGKNNEYYKINKEFTSEKDIFNFLGIKYINPKNRNDNSLNKY